MKFSKKEIFTLPNILTYIRILCVPFFVWFMLDSSIPNNIYIAFGLFIFASVTDLIDGFIARHFKLISDIGKIADPIADKLLQVSTLFCLTYLGKINLAFPIVFIIKETYMVLGGSAIVKIFKSEYIIQSNIFGKAATCLNALGIVLAFFVTYDNPDMRVYDIVVNIILICGAVFAVVTAIIYTIQFIKFRINEVSKKRLKACSDCIAKQENIIDAEVEESKATEEEVVSVESDEIATDDSETYVEEKQ